MDGASLLLRGAHRRTSGSADAQMASQHRCHIEQRRLHVAEHVVDRRQVEMRLLLPDVVGNNDKKMNACKNEKHTNNSERKKRTKVRDGWRQEHIVSSLNDVLLRCFVVLILTTAHI
jgi:hypothetical protein